MMGSGENWGLATERLWVKKPEDGKGETACLTEEIMVGAGSCALRRESVPSSRKFKEQSRAEQSREESREGTELANKPS